jgi:hypothetical protein
METLLLVGLVELEEVPNEHGAFDAATIHLK